MLFNISIETSFRVRGMITVVSIQTQNSFEACPFLPLYLDCSTRWWWKVYVDNFDVGEIFGHSVAAEVVHTESLSQAVYREALDSMGVPRATDKGGVSRETIGITMGSMIDGISGRAAPSLRKKFGPHLTHVMGSRAVTCLPPVATSGGRPLGF